MLFLHSRQIFITYIDHTIKYTDLQSEMREICGFPRTYPFTMKWVDEEGDPCTVSSQCELEEAIRLYEVNKEAELTVHGKAKFTPRFPCTLESSIRTRPIVFCSTALMDGFE